MFRKDFIVKGKHASFLDRLSKPFNEDAKLSFFERNVDVIMTSPLIGFTHNRFSKPDNSIDALSKVMADTMIKEEQNFNYIFRLIMLLHNTQNDSLERRINMAFRIGPHSEELIEAKTILEGYMLGGIEVLHEKLIESSKTYDQYLSNLCDFLTNHNERYFSSFEDDKFTELCRLACDDFNV